MAANLTNEEVVLEFLKFRIVDLEDELKSRQRAHKLYLQRQFLVLKDNDLLGESEL